MRTLTCLPLAFALIQATAFAAPPVVQTVPSLGEIEVRGVAPAYHPRPMEIAEVMGSYALDNGMTLKLSNERRRLYAQLGQRGVTEMAPVAENVYQSPDRRMTMELRPAAFGGEVLLTYPADMNVASSPMVTVRFALN